MLSRLGPDKEEEACRFVKQDEEGTKATIRSNNDALKRTARTRAAGFRMLLVCCRTCGVATVEE